MYLTGPCRTDPKAKIIEVVLEPGMALDAFSAMLYTAGTLSMQLGREIWFYVAMVMPTMKNDPRDPTAISMDRLSYHPISTFKLTPAETPTFTVDLISADAGENIVFWNDQVRGMADVEARFLD
jgi:hypothetical protein